MNAKIIRLNAILSSAMLLLYTGCGVLNLLLPLILRKTFLSLPSAVFLCLAVMVPTVVLLIYGIRQVIHKQGAFDLIFSIATLLVSVVWMVAAVLNWAVVIARNVIIEIFLRIEIPMPVGDLLTILNYVSGAYTLFSTVVALYLLAVYVVSVLRAKQKRLQCKAELHKPAVAVLILVPNLISMLQTLINPLLAQMGTDMLIRYARVVMYVSFGINTALALAAVACVLLLGLIIKKKPEATPEVQDAEQTEHQESSDLPFNVPAGVNPDDV